MKDLFSNSVTQIAIGLAFFFIAMAIAKRWSGRQAALEKDGDEKPYQVTDPYTPSADEVPPPVEAPPPIIVPPPQKVFLQFGAEDESVSDKDYVWE